MRSVLRRQLSAYFPAAELDAPFTSAPSELLPTAFRLVDATVRVLSPAALEQAGHVPSAEGLRALPPVTERAVALTTMMAIEKVAHRTQGPNNFFRAVGGVPSTSVLVVDAERSGNEERISRAVTQLCGAVVRVVSMAQQMGAGKDILLDPIRRALSASAA